MRRLAPLVALAYLLLGLLALLPAKGTGADLPEKPCSDLPSRQEVLRDPRSWPY